MRICFVGDSFVNGTGDPHYLGWTGRIVADACQKGHDITLYNLGIRRETTADIADRWFAEISRRLPPEVDGRLVFSFGVNDTTEEEGKYRVDPESSIAHTRKILTRAKRLYPTLMVGPPPVGDRLQNQAIAELSDRFEGLCESLEVPFLDVFKSLVRSPMWIQEAAGNDGAHPQQGGYQELADLVLAWPSWRQWF
ncbi:lipase [Oxynema sp. CENA135]|uniref:GDSL-type esterase/lipase family protein n=1 Tax=Oxynema sp. CENA135 TaxID=984206 RepID=UPI00190C93DB|nr:GDSL-type esterase/lipase family protein [Oxynema sp. CENA135]MBK4731767.1 lipase [Oxynema sp. CENA135]